MKNRKIERGIREEEGEGEGEDDDVKISAQGKEWSVYG